IRLIGIVFVARTVVLRLLPERLRDEGYPKSWCFEAEQNHYGRPHRSLHTCRMSGAIEMARVVLRQRFGYEDFRPGQIDVVAAVLGGNDTLAVLPTGGGKSLCYQVPALVRPGLTVVISPLISLMKDQVDRLVARG